MQELMTSHEYQKAKEQAFHTISPWNEDVYEWWHGARKLTVYEQQDLVVYLKVPEGAIKGLVIRIEEGPLTSAKFSELWQWLNTTV